MSAKEGLVIEKGSDWAIIMQPDGEFKKIRTNRRVEVGESYRQVNLLPVKYVAAAVILLAFILTSVDYFSVKAYAQVSTLAELGVNRWGRVISVKAVNNNGKLVLDQLEIKNDKLEVAVQKIYTQAMKHDSKQSEKTQKPIVSVNAAIHSRSDMEDKLQSKADQGLKKALQNYKSENRSNEAENKQFKNVENEISPDDEEITEPASEKVQENESKDPGKENGRLEQQERPVNNEDISQQKQNDKQEEKQIKNNNKNKSEK